MNYAQAGQLGAANAYNSQGQGATMQTAIPVSRTIASAVGRVDGIGERLSKVRETLAGISDAIGGPRPTSGESAKGKLPSCGVVGRLNDSAEGAHECLSDIEDLIGSIARALG